MKKKTIIAITVIASLILSMPSCTNNYFDQERYEDIMDEVFPVDIIDKDHDWNLVKNITAVVNLSSAPSAEYVVNIYDKKPTDPSARKLTTGAVNGEEVFKFSVPKDLTYKELYVTAVDGSQCVVDGYYPVSNDAIKVTPSGSVTTLTATPDVPPLEFTFCFEETFPEGGDFDFNDCVMGVSIEKSPKALNKEGNYLDITVRLRAVGGYKTMASAMRLVGIDKYDIEDSLMVLKKGWGFFNYAVDYLEDPLGKMKTAKNGDAVINLFNDAHFALNGGRLDGTGTMVPHFTINTDPKTENTEWEKATPVSSTYRISFNNTDAFNDFNLRDVDLFIITGYGMAYYETHSPAFIGINVIKDYPCQITYMPWALLIPDVFRYPNEGISICKYTKDLNLFEGAYQLGIYSFGSWARDHTNTKTWSWFRYPLNSEVYPAN
ncbi:MAG: LruC domain-containing protein [Prevotella sp.]